MGLCRFAVLVWWKSEPDDLAKGGRVLRPSSQPGSRNGPARSPARVFVETRGIAWVLFSKAGNRPCGRIPC